MSGCIRYFIGLFGKAGADAGYGDADADYHGKLFSAGPEDISELVTEPIEDAIGTLEGVDTISSTSSDGRSMVMLQYDTAPIWMRRMTT